MKKTIISFLLVCLSLLKIQAQKTEKFEITLPDTVVSNSLYNKIDYLDSRDDTTSFGFVQLGAFNRKANIVAKKNIKSNLAEVLNKMIDSSAKDGEVLFQLRSLRIHELTGSFSEHGFCRFYAALYAHAGNSYYKVSDIDTLIIVKAADVTKKILRTTNEILNNFIAAGITKSPVNNQSYSYADIVSIDSTEKRSLLIYNAEKYNEGVYKSYNSFSKNQPDIIDFTTKEKKGDLVEVRIKSENGEDIKLAPKKDIYAVVYQGTAYVATRFGYFQLQKQDDEFYFIGKDKVSANSGDVAVASAMFGLVGGLLASIPENATFQFKVRHQDGSFVPVREIKTEPNNF